MKHTDISITYNSFSETIMTQLQNDTDIENCSEKDLYINSDIKNFEDSEFNLHLTQNILMKKYYQRLKSTCDVMKLNPNDKAKYRFRPEALSTDVYNTPNLWYIILFMNHCEDVSEFNNLDEVLIPSLETITECLTNEEFILNKKPL